MVIGFVWYTEDMEKEDGIVRAVRLSLLEKPEAEREQFRVEVERILAFVEDVQSIDTGDSGGAVGRVNVFREDAVTVPAGMYRERMLEQAPARYKEWFVSKKIL